MYVDALTTNSAKSQKQRNGAYVLDMGLGQKKKIERPFSVTMTTSANCTVCFAKIQFRPRNRITSTSAMHAINHALHYLTS